MPKSQVVRWGNSLAVRIPKTVANEARLHEGDAIAIEVQGNDLKLRRLDEVPSLAELVAKITPENRYAEVPSSVEIDRETIEW